MGKPQIRRKNKGRVATAGFSDFSDIAPAIHILAFSSSSCNMMEAFDQSGFSQPNLAGRTEALLQCRGAGTQQHPPGRKPPPPPRAQESLWDALPGPCPRGFKYWKGQKDLFTNLIFLPTQAIGLNPEKTAKEGSGVTERGPEG